jgi:hypothetical protein
MLLAGRAHQCRRCVFAREPTEGPYVRDFGGARVPRRARAIPRVGPRLPSWDRLGTSHEHPAAKACSHSPGVLVLVSVGRCQCGLCSSGTAERKELREGTHQGTRQGTHHCSKEERRHKEHSVLARQERPAADNVHAGLDAAFAEGGQRTNHFAQIRARTASSATCSDVVKRKGGGLLQPL